MSKRPSFLRRKLVPVLLGCVIAGCVLPQASLAQKITPDDAYQRAAHLGLLVEKLLKQDLINDGLAPDPTVIASRPRHVLRLSTRTFENIQAVRSINGLAVNSPKPTLAEPVTPAFVVELLDDATKDLIELGAVYDVDLAIPLPTKETGKKPGDVLARLRAVNISLYRLGAPSVLPNDVFRVSKSIEEQINKVMAKRKPDARVKIKNVDKAKPADALKEAMAVVQAMETLAKANPDLAIPKGFATPPQPEKGKPVTPADVLIATEFALADIYMLSVIAGNKDPLTMPPAEAGRNPADVKNKLALVRANLDSLATPN